MRVMALFSTSFFAKYLRVGEDGPGRGHLCHTDTFLVFFSISSPIKFSYHKDIHVCFLDFMKAI